MLGHGCYAIYPLDDFPNDHANLHGSVEHVAAELVLFVDVADWCADSEDEAKVTRIESAGWDMGPQGGVQSLSRFARRRRAPRSCCRAIKLCATEVNVVAFRDSTQCDICRTYRVSSLALLLPR